MGIEYALVCNCGAVLDEEHWRKPIDIMRIGSDDLDVREEWHKFIADHLSRACGEIHVVDEYVAASWEARVKGAFDARVALEQMRAYRAHTEHCHEVYKERKRMSEGLQELHWKDQSKQAEELAAIDAVISLLQWIDPDA